MLFDWIGHDRHSRNWSGERERERERGGGGGGVVDQRKGAMC